MIQWPPLPFETLKTAAFDQSLQAQCTRATSPSIRAGTNSCKRDGTIRRLVDTGNGYIGLLRIARWRRYCQHSSLSSPLQVYQAKPIVDTKAPKERPHVASKLKKQQVSVALFPLTVERAATDTNRLTFFLPTIAHEGKELRGRSRQPALVAQDATHDGSWQRCRVQENLHAS